MKIIYNNIIPFRGFMAINILGVLFVRKAFKDRLTPVDINHEEIHTKQMKELLYVGFYILYLFFWLRNLVKGDNKAYRNIKFEKEAYSNENNLVYLSVRKKYAWRKY